MPRGQKPMKGAGPLPKTPKGVTPQWLRRALNPRTPTTKNNETMRTSSFEYEGKEILVPTIRKVDGKLKKLTPKQALDMAIAKQDYVITSSPKAATSMSRRLSDKVTRKRKK